MKNMFLNSKQAKEILGLTCEKCYDEQKGEKLINDLLGKYHHVNIVQWNNICGKMVMNYGQELWKITDVLPFHGIVIVEHDGRVMSIRLEDLKL